MQRIIKYILNKMPYARLLGRQIGEQKAFPAGHYYSPVPDKEEVLRYIRSRKPPTSAMELPGIELNADKQFCLLQQYAEFYKELPFSEEKRGECRYYYNNKFFRHSDAIFLYSFLRKHQPKRIVEIGSGFSSAVMLDTVERFFSQRPEMTSIEPRPNRLKGLLRCNDYDQLRVIEKRLQEVPFSLFSSLESGDFLFIDSSHLVKCGSDLHVLFFDIMPLLPVGVFVHFHDVFYPFDYPPDWLMQGRYWNENYFLRAFLSYSSEWFIYFFNAYVELAYHDFIRDTMPLCLNKDGRSLYLRRGRLSL